MAKETASAKEKLLEAGIEVFGRYGYEGASTRQLVEKAGVNISAIAYYFGGKEGLYAAILAHMAEKPLARIGGAAQQIRQALENPDVPDETCRALLHQFLRGMSGFLFSPEASAGLARIFMREQMDPTPAFDVLYEKTMRPMHELITRLVARLTGLPFPGEEATLCAHALIGQLTIFKTHREAALRRLGWQDYGAAEITKITDTVLRQADMVIDSYRAGKK
jgi:AcrR family transcriptional regulator